MRKQDADGANITTFGDALWWSTTTVTTVGYGDRFPVTTGGRLIAVALMVGGIAVVGAVTGSVAAWMVGQVQRDEQQTDGSGPASPMTRRTSSAAGPNAPGTGSARVATMEVTPEGVGQ